MSKNTRWALAIVGAVIIIVAAVVIGTGKDDTDATQSPNENTPTVTGETGAGGAAPTKETGGATSDSGGSGGEGSGGATAGGGSDENSGGASPQEETGGASAQGASISPLLTAGATKTITVDKGDTIVIRGRASSAGEMHVHGYDKEVALEPNKIARIKLKATIDGEFPIEFHLASGHADVGTLRVNP